MGTCGDRRVIILIVGHGFERRALVVPIMEVWRGDEAVT